VAAPSRRGARSMTSPTILRDISNLAERSKLFDQAIDAAKIHDDKGFQEAMNAFWDREPNAKRKAG
jgi:hypothetical protein